MQGLRDSGYPLRGFVSDGNADIPRAVARVFGPGVPHQLCVSHFLRNLRVKVRQGGLAPERYREAAGAILAGRRPETLEVPATLFTYQTIPGLPRTNQACENFIRFLSLRLKTIGQFQDWRLADAYLNALVLYRRFKPFTDRKRAPNGVSPLQLAGCDLTGLDYLELN